MDLFDLAREKNVFIELNGKRIVFNKLNVTEDKTGKILKRKKN